MNSDEKLTQADPDAHATADRLAREQAIKQIERRRRYWINTDMAAFGLIIVLTVVAFWAMIFHPGIAWVFLIPAIGLGFCPRYLHEPISERQIEREIERQARSAR